jgi:hypothetical protein
VRRRRFLLSITCCLILTACTIPPLRDEIEVGRDRYAIFVAGGGRAGGDLYAIRAEGGAAFPLTYTNVGEMLPALSPDGFAVAFLRSASLRDSTPGTVWVMNLLNGADREIALPKGAGRPRRVGWSRDGARVVVETATGLFESGTPATPAPPRPVPAEQRVDAESSLAVLLGSPSFTRVMPCDEAGALCVRGRDGPPALLARHAKDPLRWGADSVAYFVGPELEIRPLGPGRVRRLAWSTAPRNPRQMTMFDGGR